MLASVSVVAALFPLVALADTATNKAPAIEAQTETLARSNPEAVDRYFAPGYIQHNSDIPNGTDGLKGLIAMLGQGGNIEADFVRVIADGDMVAFHGRSTGFGETPMAAFDVFRLEDGKIVEHWDVIAPMPGPDAQHNDAGKL